MASQPRFFITRRSTTGSHPSYAGLAGHESRIVPLIPIDLLPEWVDVEGVARQLTLEETAGMTNLGGFAAVKEPLKLKFLNLQSEENAAAKHSQFTDRSRITSLSSSTDDENVGTGPVVARRAPNQLLQPPQSQEHVDCEKAKSVPGSTSDTSSSPSTLPAPPRGPRGTRHETSSHVTTISAPPDPENSWGSASNASSELPPLTKPCFDWWRHGYCRRRRTCPFKHEKPQTALELPNNGYDDWTQIGLSATSPQAAGPDVSKNPPKLPNLSKGHRVQTWRKGKHKGKAGSWQIEGKEKAKSGQSLSGNVNSHGERAEGLNNPEAKTQTASGKEQQAEPLIDL